MLAIKWKNKLEQYVTIAGFVAGVIGLIYFGVYAYQIVTSRSSGMLQLLERIFREELKLCLKIGNLFSFFYV